MRETQTATVISAGPSTRFPRHLRVFAWLSFLANVLIIGTGGAVRLTGSGLGCDQWPLCTPDSLVPTRALSWHSYVEFGNRTLTGLLVVLALGVLFSLLAEVGGRVLALSALWYAIFSIVAGVVVSIIGGFLGLPAFVCFSAALLVGVLLAAVRSIGIADSRVDLVVLAWVVLVGVVLQAFVGGITVLTDLNAFIVGFHYVSSLLLVCITAAFLVRLHDVPGPRELAVSKPFMIVTHVSTLFLALTVIIGVLTTANGPHSGDDRVVRNGFDASLLAHLHSWPGYISFALVVVLLVWAALRRYRPLRWIVTLTCALLVQIAVGVYQARHGLPPVYVGVHMVLAALTAAVMVMVVFRLKRPATEPAP